MQVTATKAHRRAASIVRAGRQTYSRVRVAEYTLWTIRRSFAIDRAILAALQGDCGRATPLVVERALRRALNLAAIFRDDRRTAVDGSISTCVHGGSVDHRIRVCRRSRIGPRPDVRRRRASSEKGRSECQSECAHETKSDDRERTHWHAIPWLPLRRLQTAAQYLDPVRDVTRRVVRNPSALDWPIERAPSQALPRDQTKGARQHAVGPNSLVIGGPQAEACRLKTGLHDRTPLRDPFRIRRRVGR